MRRILALAAIALAVLGVPAPAHAADTTAWDALIETVKQAPSSAPAPSQAYDREAHFGPAWKDVDGNGCDTRNDILSRDLTGTTYRDGTKGCVVDAGVLESDPYSGDRIEYVKGEGACVKQTSDGIEHVRLDPAGEGGCSMAVQIDHVVPLSLAWRSGAAEWDQGTREAFANDPENLLASDGTLNGLKSDKGPGQWMPEADGDQCGYSAAYANIVGKYGLAVSDEDKAVLTASLESCRDTGMSAVLPQGTGKQEADLAGKVLGWFSGLPVWGKVLAGAGALAVYAWWKSKESK